MVGEPRRREELKQPPRSGGVARGGPNGRPLLFHAALLVAIPTALMAACRLHADSGDVVHRPASAHSSPLRNPHLDESSGVVASHAHPGLLWTHNDSGDGPELFATDTTGADFGSVTVTGATNTDWEDLALGPCGTGAGRNCLWIADTGDNIRSRSSVVLYRVAEPEAPPARGGPAQTAPAEQLEVRYPDGPHDVEALAVTDEGDALLVSKTDGALVFRVPASAWGHGPVVAQPLGALPMRDGPALGRVVTGAAMAADGRLAVRTYRDIYVYKLAPDGHPRPVRGGHLDILGIELQGEGIDWLDRRTFVLTSERLAEMGDVTVVRCPSGACGAP